jgi:hypothetical protein
MSKITLKWKEEVSINGNTSKVSNIKGTLKRLGEKEFSYLNGAGEEVVYRLATISFADTLGINHTRENVVVFDTSYDQGMEVGETYLGKISRSVNADGTPRKPWVTLSALVSGTDFSDDDFEEVEIEEPEMSIQ